MQKAKLKSSTHTIGNTMLPAVHYAPSGEWGGERVNCNRYYTTDVKHTGVLSKVTCKRCLSKHSR